MKNKKVFLGISLFAMGIIFVNSNGNAKAATEDSNCKYSSISIANSDVQSIDPYIIILNNQFALSAEGRKMLSEDQIKEAEYLIRSSNTYIANNGLIIDPETKEAAVYSPFVSFAAYNKHYTYAWKWFGGRYYFTSNAAVTELVYKFRQHANNLTGVGLISGPAGTILAGAAAWKYNQIANDLENYNYNHSHNQIYMDLNWNMTYSFHILQ